MFFSFAPLFCDCANYIDSCKCNRCIFNTIYCYQ